MARLRIHGERRRARRFGAAARLRLVPALLAIAMAGTALQPASAALACAAEAHPGGDWPMIGRDLAGTRHQEAETVIGPETVAGLAPLWTLQNTDVEAPGSFPSVPVVAGGCVYVATTLGWVIALDADSGGLVWKQRLGDDTEPGGKIYGLAVAAGRVHANVQTVTGPRGAALDAATGEILWISEAITFDYPAEAIASAVVWNGMHLLPTTGPDADPKARPGIAVLDAATGAVLASGTTLPEEAFEQGHAGGGIWTTPVVDPDSGYAYTGTSNPYSKRVEHHYDNAIVKIDLNEGPTRARVVGSYKGEPDQYLPGLAEQPACEMFGDEPLLWYHSSGFSLACVQMDIDFGGSPTMFRDAAGRLIVAELQKSGAVHAVDAQTMERAWRTVVSVPPMATYTAGNSSSAANDGEHVYLSANPGVIWALDVDDGTATWHAPVGDQITYHPLAVANGIVYTLGTHGTLLAYDARDGRPLLARSLIEDVGDVCYTISGGIAIARNTVYAICDNGLDGSGWLLAYRLPG